MRLSDIKGDGALDVMADLIPPFVSIATDKEVVSAITSLGGTGVAEAASLAPLLVKSHRDDVVAILAALNGKTPDEYRAGMTLASLTTDLVGLLTDTDVGDFFGSQPTVTES